MNNKIKLYENLRFNHDLYINLNPTTTKRNVHYFIFMYLLDRILNIYLIVGLFFASILKRRIECVLRS